MKDHHFKDDNGKEITPIGPTAWEATIALNSQRPRMDWTVR